MRTLRKIIFSVNFLYIVLIAAQIAAIIFLCLFIPAVLPLAAAYAAAWFLSILTAAAVLIRGGSSESKCAWFMLIASVPIAGAALYLLAAVRPRVYGVLKIKDQPLSPAGMCAKKLCGTCEAKYGRAEYFPTGEAMLERAFEVISRAKKSIYIEFFIAARGEIFSRLVSSLKKAKARGAEIKILFDGVGTAFKLGKRDVKVLKAAGAEVRIFRRITPVPRSRLNFRDHRKIIAVDGVCAFSGGVNIADEYAGLTSPYGSWKDSGFAVYGQAAAAFEGMFLAMWRGGCELSLPQTPLPFFHLLEEPTGGDVGGRSTCDRRAGAVGSTEEKGASYEVCGAGICLPYCGSPPLASFAEEMYVNAIHAAKRRVHITTPYFCVGENLAQALACAARRGLDVKIILPHVPDKPYAFELSKATAATLKESGVKFFEYTPGFMHAKTVVIDGGAFLGSYNFDFRSMRLNYECGAAFTGEVANCAERDFEACLAQCAPLSEGKISPAKRFSRLILRLFAPLV